MTDRQADRKENSQTDGQADGKIDEEANGQLDGRTDRWLVGILGYYLDLIGLAIIKYLQVI